MSPTISLLRRAVAASYLSAAALASLYGVTDATAARWLAGTRSAPEGLWIAALRLLEPWQRAEVLSWEAELCGGGCMVVDLETYRAVQHLQALGQRRAA